MLALLHLSSEAFYGLRAPYRLVVPRSMASLIPILWLSTGGANGTGAPLGWLRCALYAQKSYNQGYLTPGQSNTRADTTPSPTLELCGRHCPLFDSLLLHIDYAFQPEPSLTIVTFHVFSHSHPGVNRSYPIYGDPAIAQKRKQGCFGEPRVGGERRGCRASERSVIIGHQEEVWSFGVGGRV